MSLHVDAVVVRVKCVRKNWDDSEDMFGARCSDEACRVCGGTGSYVKEISLRDFAQLLRDELNPPPDSQG